LRGNPSQLITQIVAVAIAYIVAAVGTFILLKILDATVGLRLKPEAEVQGMDIHEHGEEGYGRDFTGGISLQESTSNLAPFLSDDNLRVNSTSPEFKTVSTPQTFLA